MSHSLDRAPGNYYLFHKLNDSLAVKTFPDDNEDRNAVMTSLRDHAEGFYDARIRKQYLDSKLKNAWRFTVTVLKRK